MYTYSRLTEDLDYLAYCGIDVGSLGKSVAGYSIPYVHIGEYNGGQSIITGGIHARENVTSLLVMRQAFRTAFKRRAFEGGIYFVPMVNPDGAILIEKGAAAFADRAEYLCEINQGTDFSMWKANLNGVDLNNNFDARFRLGKGQKDSPASQGYPGEFAFSEPETSALKKFTLSVAPKITLSYHALGRELYWYFFQSERLNRDKVIAQRLEAELGYKRIDSDLDSTGGYKDWCVQCLGIPSVTVEIITEQKKHPLCIADLDEDWAVNKNIPYILSQIALELAQETKIAK